MFWFSATELHYKAAFVGTVGSMFFVLWIVNESYEIESTIFDLINALVKRIVGNFNGFKSVVVNYVDLSTQKKFKIDIHIIKMLSF